MRVRSALAGLAVAAVVAVVPVAAAIPSAWNHWRYSAPVAVDATTSARLVGVVVPRAVIERSGRAPDDFRVIDADGVEVPFVFRVRRGTTESAWRQAKVLEPSVAPGAYTQATIDLGPAAPAHNTIRLDLTSDGDFLTWVEVAISENATSWRILRDRAPVYNLQSEGMGRAVEVTYPESLSRYLRIRVLDGTKPYRVIGAEVASLRTTAPDLVPAEAAFAQDASRPHKTTWVSTTDVSGDWVSVLRVEGTPDAYDRPVSVETSQDGRTWQAVAYGEIYRRTDRGQERESSAVRIPETQASHWRVTIDNRNDAPLAGVRPVLYVMPRRVVFRQEPGRQYRLLYGNAKAVATDYEFARLTEADAIDAAAPAQLGAEELNAAYVDPSPWTEQHPIVLWAALGLAVVVLVVLALVALRTVRTS